MNVRERIESTAVNVRERIVSTAVNVRDRLRRFLRDIKFRNKIILLTIGAGLLPVLLISVYMQRHMAQLLRTREINAMNRSLQQAVETVENQAEIYENLINYLSYSKELRGVLSPGEMTDYDRYVQYNTVVDPLLRMPQLYHKEIRSITLYADSIPVPHGSTLSPLVKAKGEDWFPSGEAKGADGVPEGQEAGGQAPLLRWHVRRGAKKEIVAVRRFYNDDDVGAVMAIRLDYDAVLAPLVQLVQDDTGLLITDASGQTVYSGYAMDGASVAHPEDVSYIRKHYTTVADTIGSTGWSCRLYRKEAVLTRAVSRLAMGNVPIIAASIGILVLIGYYFSGKTVKPLERLTENINQVHLGVRTVTVHSEAKDEVGVLIRSFSRMMEQINRLINEVYEGQLQLARTEMKALQAQINPHFLYNSLSIINWKALEAGEDEISQVTLALSTYYRTSLNRGETMTTVEKEIQNIRAYLRIQLVMHDDRFTVQEELDTSLFPCRIPKLILQPLAENAIDHGLDPSDREDRQLSIRLYKEGETFCLEVEDNGCGMPQETAGQILTYHSKGYGVRNVAQRLHLTYKEEGMITVKSRPGEGTKITIRLPMEAPEG